jgi:hypothetical protein
MKKKFEHLMLDIETMGSESYSAIVSIAAVEFDIETGETGQTFKQNIFLDSCLKAGLNVDGNTIMWWMSQSDEARNSLVGIGISNLESALKSFSEFFHWDYCVWGNSARFDCGILQNAYNKVGKKIPWDFRKERCVRTLVSFNPELKASIERDGVAHDALDDCLYQIKYCTAIWNSLKRTI